MRDADRSSRRLARRGALGLCLILGGVMLGMAWSPPLPIAQASAGGATDASEPAANPLMFDGYGGERWGVARPAPEHESSPSADTAIADLAAIGYAAGSQPARGDVGVTVHDRGRTQPGLNLCNFGHQPAALLIDMDGRTRHTWSFDLERETGRPTNEHHWRRVLPLADGDLLAIQEGQYLLRLDRESNLRWCFEGGAHHDVDVTADGTIHVLTREARLIARIDLARPCLEDFVSTLDADGNELRRVSILRALERSAYAPLLTHGAGHGDLTHTNTLEVLDGRHASTLPAFAAGNLLLSMRELDTIAVLDPEAERIVWALTGMWKAQHQPTLLDDGKLLLFDNKGRHGLSRVLEFDPLTQLVSWSYEGSDGADFFSAECGSVQRLANGNTLVTETDLGRAFEVTRAGEIVWEYRTPYRAGPRGQYVASLFEVVRLDADHSRGWLAAEASAAGTGVGPQRALPRPHGHR